MHWLLKMMISQMMKMMTMMMYVVCVFNFLIVQDRSYWILTLTIVLFWYFGLSSGSKRRLSSCLHAG